MELSVHNRLHLQHFIPKEGNFLTMTIAKDLISKINFSQEEYKTFGIRPSEDESQIIWDKEAPNSTIEFTEPEIELLKKQVEALDKKNKITSASFDVAKLIKEL